MSIQSIPDSYFPHASQVGTLCLYDLKMTEDVVLSKVQLTCNMFSFLQQGAKKVHCEGDFVAVNPQQSVLIRAGNCLVTELPNQEEVYFCKLFFFTHQDVAAFLQRHPGLLAGVSPATQTASPFFVIENDAFIHSFVASISFILQLDGPAVSSLLAAKFEEILLYLAHKYGAPFLHYLADLASSAQASLLRKIVAAHAHHPLDLGELAFLANMSLSKFKRDFVATYGIAPGKYFHMQRLLHARARLAQGETRPSELYADYGYNSLSNFCIAFKKAFGYSPGQTQPEN